MNLCQYKNIFGEPNTGIHAKYRLFDIALVDVVATIIGTYILSIVINRPFIQCALFVFVLMLFLHRIFCVRTTTDKWFFPNE
jgi:hypothetical protein